MANPEPLDPVQRQLAERRLLAALARFHRRQPLQADVRVDALLADLRAHADRRPRGHRGATRLTIDDAAVRAVVDDLVARGAVARDGHRVRLPGHVPILDPTMRERVDRLLAGLATTGSAPPRVEGIAARLGIPPALLDQLRAAGELVVIGSGIEYPRATWEEISERVDRMVASGPLTIARVRDELRTSRRHAEAIVGRRREERRRRRDRRAVR